jgi:hypothetical protein
MSGGVGGTPETISAGARQLSGAARAVGATGKGISSAGGQAAGAAGDGRIAAAVERFAAAWSRTTEDVGTELRAAALLANNAAEDLAVAGGQRPR